MIRKLLYSILSLLLAISGIFFCSCTNTDSCYKLNGEFFIEHAEWVSDELSFESMGYFRMFGKMKINGEEIEVIVVIHSSTWSGIIYKLSDFSEDMIETIKNPEQLENTNRFTDYVRDNRIEPIYTFKYSTKWTEPVRVEITFNRYPVNDVEGIPDKSGETIVLTRQDVTPA